MTTKPTSRVKAPGDPAPVLTRTDPSALDWPEWASVSKRQRAESDLHRFFTHSDLGVVVSGLFKCGWSSARISERLARFHASKKWAEFHGRSPWWGWSIEVRKLRAGVLANAARRLQSALKQVGLRREELLASRMVWPGDEPPPLEMLIHLIFGVHPAMPEVWDGGDRGLLSLEANYLDDREPLLSLATLADTLSETRTVPGRQDADNLRRRIACEVAGTLQGEQVRSWARFSSLIVTALFGRELSERQLRAIIADNVDIVVRHKAESGKRPPTIREYLSGGKHK